MNEENRVFVEPLNAGHRMDLGIALGLRAAINILHERRDTFEKLPGFNTAIALIEAVEADMRADVAGKNFRAVAAAGLDVQTHIVGLIGKGRIYAEPMDLAQMADFAGELAK